MILQIVTDAVISKGYNGTPAFYQSEDGRMLGFKVGCKVYDRKAEHETRWINYNVYAFDDLADRVKRMNLKEGAHINVIGSFDMRPWANRETGEVTTWPTIRAMQIEYAASLPRQEVDSPTQATASQEAPTAEPVTPEQLSGFTGYEPFGSDNSFYNAESPL